MITNRILNLILNVFSLVIIPFQIVTTLVLGIAVTVTFGFLLLPISLVWAILLFPMIGLSWICKKVPVLRNVIGIIFIPWVAVAYTYIALMPSMGELENRASKLMLCATWPYTWEFWQFLTHNLDLDSFDDLAVVNLNIVIKRISEHDPQMQQMLVRVKTRQELDPHV